MLPHSNTGGPAAVLDRVSVTYGAGAAIVHALRDVSLEVPRGEVTLLMGPSGSGKTTLLQVLGCLRRPTSGQVYIAGSCINGMGERDLSGVRSLQIGFVFQQYNLLPTLTAWENVAVALELQGRQGWQLERLSRDLLARFGMADRADAFPGELSGGQRQRIAIARAMVGGPRIILADEPTAALDGAAGANVTGVLRDLAREYGRSVVIVTHDTRMEGAADNVLLLEDGKIISSKRNSPAQGRRTGGEMVA